MLREVGVIGLDAGVEHSPHHVLTKRREGDARGVGFYGAHRFVHQRADLEVGPDAEDWAVGLIELYDAFDHTGLEAGEEILLAALAGALVDPLGLLVVPDFLDGRSDQLTRSGESCLAV